MKMLSMLLLASGFLTAPAMAQVGRDREAPRCEQVIKQIQDTLKRERAPGDPVPASGPVAPATSAQ